MSDFSASGDLSGVKRVGRVEFSLYFTMIFTLALGLHLIRYPFVAVRDLALPKAGPIACAIKDARAITPMIFRG
ncbi:MAG: cytochrome PufQ [Cypionkella sp.]|nr:cytochrome PufQ [Cypionkella sp.]